MDYAALIGLGIDLVKYIVGEATKRQAPQDVLDALQATVIALEKHKSDIISKANLEALRG